MDLGDTKDAIMDAALDIVDEINNENLINEGPLQILTKLSGEATEINIYVKDGTIINFDMFKGWSNRLRNRHIYW